MLRAVVFACLWAAAPTSSRTVKKQLRWYLGNPPEVQEFIVRGERITFNHLTGEIGNSGAIPAQPGPAPGPRQEQFYSTYHLQ